MARSVFHLDPVDNKHWHVILRANGKVVAHLYRQSGGDGYRFRLSNYSHRMSKMYPRKADALAALREEVL